MITHFCPNSSFVGLPHPICGCGYGTEDLPHARASSRCGYDPDGPVAMAPFQGSIPEDFPRQPEIKKSCQWSPPPPPDAPPARPIPPACPCAVNLAADLRSRHSWIFHTLDLQGAGAGRRTYYCLMPGRLLVGDTTPTDQVAMVRTIVSGIMPVPSPHRPRARALSRMRSRQVEGGIRLGEFVFGGDGREAQLKLHTQPTAGGRTLVDADRIKAARVGDPRRRRSNRARLPTTDQGIYVSDDSSQGSTCQRAASFDLFVQSCLGCQSDAYARPPAGARVAAHALSVGWGGYRAVKRWLTKAGKGTTRSTHADDRRPAEADERGPRRGSTTRQ
ncbi:hypothetical protein EVAR_26106_1 [Eumeta japonica]|uniref:Uncharacterized protein n=1 Tax=Eumeta variegata TaxID=151549 RepID=A0A4C1X1F3_EUMVA|nr:hypothetical protein EVAR_26106_1 [Eumeta japonica]